MLQFNQFGIPLVGAAICGFIGESGFQFIGILYFNKFGIPRVGAEICGLRGECAQDNLRVKKVFALSKNPF